MQIIYIERLDAFAKKHAHARRSLAAWKAATLKAQWTTKQDVLKDFPRAKIISEDRARFEIVHNIYRLIARIFYRMESVEVRFIGTHNEYDRIDPKTI
jgi:mRNA interferase HigB